MIFLKLEDKLINLDHALGISILEGVSVKDPSISTPFVQLNVQTGGGYQETHTLYTGTQEQCEAYLNNLHYTLAGCQGTTTISSNTLEPEDDDNLHN